MSKPSITAIRRAVFPGSFDPMTRGHLDVIERTSRLFDEVIVAVGEARDKSPLFPTKERVAIVNEVCAELGNVKAEAFTGLVVDFARKRGAVALVRGIRSGSDYDYEMQMALMNRAMHSDLETIFIPTNPSFSHISSSLAKEIAKHGGDVSLLVPGAVASRLLSSRSGGRS